MSSTQPQAPSVVFEPRSGETWRDPFPMYKALRDNDPVHKFELDLDEFWTLSRFKDVFAAAVDLLFPCRGQLLGQRKIVRSRFPVLCIPTDISSQDRNIRRSPAVT